jgi:hypothetical protein
MMTHLRIVEDNLPYADIAIFDRRLPGNYSFNIISCMCQQLHGGDISPQSALQEWQQHFLYRQSVRYCPKHVARLSSQKMSSCIKNHRIQFKNIALQHIFYSNENEAFMNRLIPDFSKS